VNRKRIDGFTFCSSSVSVTKAPETEFLAYSAHSQVCDACGCI